MANYNLGEARGKIVLETDFKSLGEAQQALDGYKKAADDAATSQKEAWRKTGTAATVGGLAVAAGFAVAVGAAGSFEHRMSGIQAVSGATAEEMDLIRQAALRIGKDTAFSANEAGLAMEELIKAGLSVEDVLNGAADATVALAAAGGVDLPTAATIASNAMNQFNLGAEDLVNVADKIAGAANASAIDVTDFGMSMSQVGAVANLVGLSFDDTALAIAAMGNAGIKGSDAGTSLKTMLLNLNPSTQEAADLMKELGIITEDGANQFYTAEGSIKSMSEISDVLNGALAGMTDAQKQATLATLFGADAIRGAAVVADTGAAGFDTLSESMTKVTAADVAATRLDNLQGSTEQLLGSLETLWISIGSEIIPVLRSMVDQITGAVNWFAGLDAGVRNTIVGVTAAVGGFLLLFGATIKIVQGIQGAIAVIKSLQLAMVATRVATAAMAVVQGIATAAQWAWNAAMTANPIGIIIVAIAALVAAIIWFFTQTELGKDIWAGFIGWLQEAWTNVSSFFVDLWNGIVAVFTTVWEAIQTAIDAVVQWFGTYVVPIIAAYVQAWITIFTFLWNVITTVFNAIMAVIGAVVDWFMTYVWPVIEAFINLVVAIFNFLWWSIQETFNTIWNFIAGIVQTIVDFVVGAFNAWLDQVKAVLKAIGDFFVSIWNKIVAFLFPIVMNIVKFVMQAWANIQQVTSTIFNAVSGFISSVWNNIVNWISNAVNTAWNFIKSVWGNIVGFVQGVFNNVYNAIKTPIDNAINFIKGFKDKIVGFFAGAGEWLVQAGKNIIDGLVNGIKGALGWLTDTLNGITNLIPEVKGPPEKDKVLLTDNGKLIMQSLINGLRAEKGNLIDELGGLNTTIPATLQQDIYAGSAAGAGGGANITLNVTWNAAPGDTNSTREQVMQMLGHATELVREELK